MAPAEHVHRSVLFAIVASLAIAAATSGAADAQARRPEAGSATWVARDAAPSVGAGVGTSALAVAGVREIVVTGDGAFPARASAPVLYVGSVGLRKFHYAGTESRTLVFAVPPDVTLEDGAPIYLQYEPGGRPRIDMGTFRSMGQP